VSISPKIKSICIRGCYSKFIQNTVVPVHFSYQISGRPVLYSHISTLQPQRRREEYKRHDFQLHDEFSDAMYQLLYINKKNLNILIIEYCTLDFEMTELFCTVASHGKALETFIYNDNGDKGISCSVLLQTLVTTSPHMQHFRGRHAGINDTVLYTISRHWKSLKSLTLCSATSKESVITTRSEDGISSQGFWKLLCQCQKLNTLELFDLACLSNRDLTLFLYSINNNKLVSPSTKKRKYSSSPYSIPTTMPPIRSLLITKYTTTPLSKQGFESLLNLFPKLNYLKYETNFHTFDNLFQGVTRDMFYAECNAVQDWCNLRKDRLQYIGNWNSCITTEQRLILSSSIYNDSLFTF
jgi:hypothetical protein